MEAVNSRAEQKQTAEKGKKKKPENIQNVPKFELFPAETVHCKAQLASRNITTCYSMLAERVPSPQTHTNVSVNHGHSDQQLDT